MQMVFGLFVMCTCVWRDGRSEGKVAVPGQIIIVLRVSYEIERPSGS